MTHVRDQPTSQLTTRVHGHTRGDPGISQHRLCTEREFAVVWLNISPRPLFHITSIYFESKSGRRQTAIFVTVERAASIV